MKRTLLIHIGFDHCGGDELCNALSQSRDVLREQGLLFPITGEKRQMRTLANDIPAVDHAPFRILFCNPDIDEASSLWRELTQELNNSGAKTVVISSDSFSFPDMIVRQQSIEKLRSLFDRINVVAYVRRQDVWIDDFYRATICSPTENEQRTFERFLADEEARWLDFEARLSPWSTALGAGSIVVRSLDDIEPDPAGCPPGEFRPNDDAVAIISDFAAIAGFTPPPSFNEDASAVPPDRLTLDHIPLILGINALTHMQKSDKDFVIRKLGQLPGHDDDCSSVLTQAQFELLRKQYGPRNRDLVGKFGVECADRFMFANSIDGIRFRDEAFPPKVRIWKRIFERVAFGKHSRPAISEIRPALGPSTPPLDVHSKRADLGRFGITALVNETDDQLRRFVGHHLAIGAKHIVLFLDDPKAAIRTELEEMTGVTVVPCTSSFWIEAMGRLPETNGEKLECAQREGYARLREFDVDWITNLDGDELIHCDIPIDQYLSTLPGSVDQVQFRAMEAVFENGAEDAPVFSNRYFKQFADELAPIQAALIEEHKPLLHQFGRCGFLGHSQGRRFSRSDLKVNVHRSHTPKVKEGTAVVETSTKARILHFDATSYSGWKAKWSRRLYGMTNAVNVVGERKMQQDLIRRAFETDEAALRTLFRDFWSFEQAELDRFIEAGLIRDLGKSLAEGS